MGGGYTVDRREGVAVTLEMRWSAAAALTDLYAAEADADGEHDPFFDAPFWKDRPLAARLLRRYQRFHQKSNPRRHHGVHVRPVGQLCNRLMAIASGFIFALLTRRALTVEDSGFYASMNDLFLKPGFEWLRRPSASGDGIMIANPYGPPWRETEPLLCQNLTKAYPSPRQITLSMNQYSAPYLLWNPHYRPALQAIFGNDLDLFTPVARFLFRPVPELQKLRDEYMAQNFKGKRVAGLQVRSGQDFTSHFMGKKDWDLYARCGREGLRE
eukprot:Hpha_TRINITY_DN10008_c0_g1::TRINITY_DN10008_c0_g1_i2::g.84018::m.84018/K13681/FUT; xyloglucan fucosyltransferase